MARVARNPILALLGLLGCQRPMLSVPLPVDSSTRAIVLAVEARAGSPRSTRIRAEALRLEDSSPLQLTLLESDLSSAAPLELTAMLYASTLDALGIPPGPLTAGGGTRPLPPPELSVLARQIESNSQSGSWEPLPAAIPPVLSDIQVPELPAEACARFESRRVVLPDPFTTSDRVFFGAALDDAHALLALERGAVTVSSTGAVTVLDEQPANPYWGGTVLEDGSFLLASIGYQLWRARLVGDRLLAEPVPSLPPIDSSTTAEQIHWLTASTSTRGVEVFALTISRELLRLEAGRWVLLHRFAGPSALMRGGLVQLGPGEVLAVNTSEQVVWRWNHGVLSEEDLPPRAVPSALALHPTLGLLLGQDDGGFLQRDPIAGWQPLPLGPSNFQLDVLTMVPYRDGFLYGGLLGFVGQYRSNRGFCDPGNLAFTDGDVVVAFAGGAAIIGGIETHVGLPVYPALLVPQ